MGEKWIIRECTSMVSEGWSEGALWCIETTPGYPENCTLDYSLWLEEDFSRDNEQTRGFTKEVAARICKILNDYGV